jgi:hypothetical protein
MSFRKVLLVTGASVLLSNFAVWGIVLVAASLSNWRILAWLMVVLSILSVILGPFAISHIPDRHGIVRKLFAVIFWIVVSFGFLLMSTLQIKEGVSSYNGDCIVSGPKKGYEELSFQTGDGEESLAISDSEFRELRGEYTGEYNDYRCIREVKLKYLGFYGVILELK